MSLPDEKQLFAIIDSPYVAALGEASWDQTLTLFLHGFGASSTQLISIVPKEEIEFTRSFTVVNPDTHGQYTDATFTGNWSGFDFGSEVRFAHAVKKPPGHLFFDYQFITEQEMVKHPLYQEFLAQFNQRYHLGVNLNNHAGEYTSLILNHPPKSGHMTTEQIKHLN